VALATDEEGSAVRATIASVDPEARIWQGPKGPVAFVSGTLSDGSRWSRGTRPESAAERIAAMQALVGQELDLQLEDRGERNGVREWRLAAWPDKQQEPRREWRQAWLQSEQGAREIQERTDRRTALMQAVALGVTDIGEVLRIAEQMYAWLRETVPAEVEGEGAEAGQRTGGGGRLEGERTTAPAAPSSSGCPTCGESWGPRTTSSGKRLCVRGHVERG
jgi:hypothetical protein